MKKNILVVCEKKILVVQESYQSPSGKRKKFSILKIGQVSSCLQYHSLLNITDRSSLKYKQHDVIDDLCVPKSRRT